MLPIANSQRVDGASATTPRHLSFLLFSGRCDAVKLRGETFDLRQKVHFSLSFSGAKSLSKPLREKIKAAGKIEVETDKAAQGTITSGVSPQINVGGKDGVDTNTIYCNNQPLCNFILLTDRVMGKPSSR